MMKDYYYILGINESANSEQIKKAYRKLSLKFHPDKNDGDDFFADRFKEINEAYEILIDPVKRANYDGALKSRQSHASNKNSFSPVIEVFVTDKIEFEYNEELKISWKVSNADLVIITPFGNVEPVGTKTYKFKTLKSKELIFELSATNTYIGKTVKSSLKVKNRTYEELYQKVKDDFEKSKKEEIKHKYEALIPCRKADRWGFCTPKRRVIVDFIYEDAQQFNDGLAPVKKNGKWGFMNENAEEVIQCKYDSVSPFTEGLAQVSKSFKIGFINKNGDEVIRCQYKTATYFSENVAAVSEYGIFQKLLIYSKLVSRRMYVDWIVYGLENGLEYKFIDKFGKQVIPSTYINVRGFTEGLCVHKTNGKYGYINKKGEQIIPNKYISAQPFSEGLSAVKLNYREKNPKEVTGFIDKFGKVKLLCTYDEVYSFCENLAPVKICGGNGYSLIGKYGFIDKSGKEVIACIYDDVNSFSEGLAGVSVDKNFWTRNYGFINPLGEVVIPFKYDWTSGFENGYARVRLKGKEGYINQNGVQFWED